MLAPSLDRLGRPRRRMPSRARAQAVAALGHRVQAVDGDGRSSGTSPSSLMWRSLASSSLSRIGCGSAIWRHARGRRVEQVALGADAAAESGDQLLADGVERRVGDLGEQLREVVEQQPRPVRQHRDRACRCPSSRAPRRRSGHRRDEELAAPRACSRRSCWRTHAARAAGSRTCARRAGRRGGRGRRASHSPYGCSAASVALISSSPTMRPCAVSTRNMRPGCSRPFCDDRRPGRCRARRPRTP